MTHEIPGTLGWCFRCNELVELDDSEGCAYCRQQAQLNFYSYNADVLPLDIEDDGVRFVLMKMWKILHDLNKNYE